MRSEINDRCDTNSNHNEVISIYRLSLSSEPKGSDRDEPRSGSDKDKGLDTVIGGRSPSFGSDVGELFLGYFHNHMTLLLWMIQSIRKRDERFMIRREFFLEDLEHHFIEPGAGKEVINAIHWLKEYLKRYPKVTFHQSVKAIEKIGLIYRSFGLELTMKIKSV